MSVKSYYSDRLNHIQYI